MVTNDILKIIDQKVVLVLNELSAAFNMIDHTILLNRLSNQMGIKGMALKWFQSYLLDRYQYVKVEGEVKILCSSQSWCTTMVSFRSNLVQHLYNTSC